MNGTIRLKWPAPLVEATSTRAGDCLTLVAHTGAAPTRGATLDPRGERSSVGRAPGCGPGGRRFESGRSPLKVPCIAPPSRRLTVSPDPDRRSNHGPFPLGDFVSEPPSGSASDNLPAQEGGGQSSPDGIWGRREAESVGTCGGVTAREQRDTPPPENPEGAGGSIVTRPWGGTETARPGGYVGM